MTRSADVLSTADMETSILNHNTRCLNLITNGNNFVPLQSVKEDECLEENAAAADDDKKSFLQVNQSSSSASRTLAYRLLVMFNGALD